MTVLDVSVGADTDSHAMYSNHSINNLFADVKEEGEFGVAFAIAAILMILTLLINLSATLVGKYFAKRRNV